MSPTPIKEKTITASYQKSVAAARMNHLPSHQVGDVSPLDGDQKLRIISSIRQRLLLKSLVPDTFRMSHPLALHHPSPLKPTSHPQIPKPLGPPRLLGKASENHPYQRGCSIKNTPKSKVG